ncbi:MAG: response regulator, partial [Burkholderiales bacterium]|nr:response regulator [Burkholderiales bacterium]
MTISQFSLNTREHKRTRILAACLYVLVIAYIFYVTFNLWRVNQKTDEIYETNQVSSDVRNMQVRVLEIRNAVPFIFNDGRPIADVISLLQIQEKEQISLFKTLEKHFRGTPQELVPLKEAVSKLQEIRNLIEQRGKDPEASQKVNALYRSYIEPAFDNLDSVLDQVGDDAEDQARETKEDADALLNSVVMASFLIGVAVVWLLWLVLNSEHKIFRALKSRDHLFELLSNTVDDVFIIFNGKHEVEYVSSNAPRLIGLTGKSLRATKGTILADLLPRQAYTWLNDRLNPHKEFDHEEKHVDISRFGKTFRLMVYKAKAKYGKGDESIFIVILLDITEILRTQQALKDAFDSATSASQAKSRFLSHMSHEIRTPMNAIIGMTEIALTKIGDQAKVKDCLTKIGQSSQHLLGLINDILDMSRIEENRMSIAHEKFDFQDSINSVISIVENHADEKKLHFDVTFSDVNVETLIGDSVRLGQILLNILSNAVKFTPEGGHVTMSVQELWKKGDNVFLQFLVKDNGIGMSPEFLNKIFLPFEQEGKVDTGKYRGSGLGMPITKNLITLMGGTISVKSTEGEGTEVSVELPFGYVATEQPRSEELGSYKCLVIDDDPGTCEHASLLLGKLGQKTSTALSGEQGIEMIKKAQADGDPYQVAFVDWKMPHMDGEETAKRISALEGSHMLIIFISAYDWAPIEEAARKAGVSGFVSKPFFLSSLRDALKAVAPVSNKDEAAEKKADRPDFSGKRVLLAEDNDFNQEVACEFLEMAGAKVDTAANGQEAVDEFLKAPSGYYNVILMDIQMPVKNGYEATEEIRASKHPDAQSIPIIAMTANAFTEDVAKSLASGMNAHLSKPLSMNALYGT